MNFTKEAVNSTEFRDRVSQHINSLSEFEYEGLSSTKNRSFWIFMRKTFGERRVLSIQRRVKSDSVCRELVNQVVRTIHQNILRRRKLKQKIETSKSYSSLTGRDAVYHDTKIAKTVETQTNDDGEAKTTAVR
jgi:hypothetical protein